MLTGDVIKQNKALEGLTDDQIKAIEELSKNDENQVIGKKTNEFWSSIDKDMEELGFPKPPTVKSYNHFKDVVKGATGDYSKLQEEKKELEGKITGLEKKIAEGAGDDVKSQLADLEKKLSDKANEVSTWKKKYESDLEAKSKEVEQLNERFKMQTVDKAFSHESLKPKAGIPDVAFQATLELAKKNLLSNYKAEVQKGDNGKELVIFRDNEGNIALNPENGLQPYKAHELLLKDQSLKEVIDTGRKVEGNGGKPGTGSDKSLELGNVKTRPEATRAIQQVLAQKGVTVDNPEYQKMFDEQWESSKASELPMQ